MKRYYAANNQYGTPTSIGFANTWFVLAFESRAARDTYVAKSDSIAAKAITRREVSDYAASHDAYNGRRPRPFSGEYWGIGAAWPCPDGCIGQITVADPNDDYPRLY